MGKMDIDYSILHDAFFKYQDKPKMTRIGELYYEGMQHVSAVSRALSCIFHTGRLTGQPPVSF